eukprot:3758519-Pleurochrysis_carterae.AAC.5
MTSSLARQWLCVFTDCVYRVNAALHFSWRVQSRTENAVKRLSADVLTRKGSRGTEDVGSRAGGLVVQLRLSATEAEVKLLIKWDRISLSEIHFGPNFEPVAPIVDSILDSTSTSEATSAHAPGEPDCQGGGTGSMGDSSGSNASGIVSDQTSVLWPTASADLLGAFPSRREWEGDWTSVRVVRRHFPLALAHVGLAVIPYIDCSVTPRTLAIESCGAIGPHPNLVLSRGTYPSVSKA